MTPACRATTLLAVSVLIAACGGSGSGPQGSGPPINTDYSGLRMANSHEGTLRRPHNEEEFLRLLRNGLRLSLDTRTLPVGVFAPSAQSLGSYSDTTEQVAGVNEADLVKYDGRHLFIVRPEPAPHPSDLPDVSMTRNVLKIVRTDAATAVTTVVSEYEMEGRQNAAPLIYLLQADDGPAHSLVAVSHNFIGWLMPQPMVSSLAAQPDKVTVELFDVRDPHNVSRSWKLEIDGWLRTSRKIGDRFYLVTSFYPRLAGLLVPAHSMAEREANELRIRSAAADEILPGYRLNDGANSMLVRPADCVLTAQTEEYEAYIELTVITAIDLVEGRVRDARCVSTNVNGVYMSAENLYIGGDGTRSGTNTPMTVLHKFGLHDGEIEYEASGAVDGRVGWTNASYYMAEREQDLRIVTTESSSPDSPVHRLNVLRHDEDDRLAVLATLPNAARPAAIGKPGDDVHAVRFVADRAYIVTARSIDPLYVIDLSDPADPFIAGEVEVPGFATYLHPLDSSPLLLSVGQHADSAGVPQGVKVELFDVSDANRPRSLAVEIFGTSAWSEAIGNPHAVTFLSVPGDEDRYRIALPIHVYDTVHPDNPAVFGWSYSGLHLLEVQNARTSPRLHFQGVIRTAEPGAGVDDAHYPEPNRGVMHGESVFAIHGEIIESRLWGNVSVDF